MSSCVSSEINLDPMQVQQVLSTVDPCLHLPSKVFFLSLSVYMTMSEPHQFYFIIFFTCKTIIVAMTTVILSGYTILFVWKQ